MIFNLNSAKSKKLPILNADYPQDVTVNSGNNAVFNASIEKDGHPTEYTYQWYVNGTKVDEATGATYVRDTSSDKGQYVVFCEVTNKAGTVQTRIATMTVNKAPVLDESYPADVSVDVTNGATFTVNVSDEGYPASLTYQWYVDGSAVSGATGTSYTIASAAKGTTSVYCIVSNGIHSVTSRTAKLTATKLWLFDNGNQYNDVTGGWTGGVTGSAISPASLAINRTSNEIDFKDYKTLYFELSEVNLPPQSWQSVLVTTNPSTSGDMGQEGDYAAMWNVNPSDWTTVGGEKTVDVTNVSVPCYVKISQYNTSIYVTKVYME